MENENTQLKEIQNAFLESKQIGDDISKSVNEFLVQVQSDEDTDQTIIAELVCIRALRGLSLPNLGRVLRNLNERFKEPAAASKTVLQSAKTLVEHLEFTIRRRIWDIDVKLDALDFTDTPPEEIERISEIIDAGNEAQ